MIPTWKVHAKFYQYFKSQYQHKDIMAICKFIVKEAGLKQKGDHLVTVKNNWEKVCNFLIKWEGKNK